MSVIAERGGLRRITIVQGETHVSDETDVVLATLLGSCVAACLHDPVRKVGGINHYLLAEGTATDEQSMQRYGVYAMEVLINAMLAMGAARQRLKARIFGGASMHSGFRDIGGANVAFARNFLRSENIALVGEDVGGFQARRVEFRAAHGLVRCRSVAGTAPPDPVLPVPASTELGEVEFF